MHFDILRYLRVLRDGEVVDLGRHRQRVLLARLLIDVNRAVSVDRLIDDVWDGDPPQRAVASLQAYVSRLRNVLEPDRPPRQPATVLVTQPPGYMLRVDQESIDASRFAELQRQGRAALATGNPHAALEALDEALGLWRGEPLADLNAARFVAAVATRLTDMRSDAVEDRGRALLALSDAQAAIMALEAQVEATPWRESTWELLLRALHSSGRTADALERYQVVRERLADDLGIEPGRRLQELQQAILRGDALATSTAPPGDGASSVTTGRAAAPPEPPEPPASDAGIVGREREVEALTSLMTAVASGSTSWTVITGEPGVGKTRLAEQASTVARGQGIEVVWARCHEDDGTPTHWAWVQLLRGLGDDDGAEALLRGDEAVGDDATTQRFLRYDRVAATLTAVARRRPVLLVVDDLQWSDDESLGLLTYLAVQLTGVPLAGIVTIRSQARRAELERAAATLSRQRGLRIDLTGLDSTATAALAERVSHVRLTPDEMARLAARTAGNPFFVVELARLGAAALRGDALPGSVRDVLRQRFGQLPEDAVALLTLGAVTGAEFAFGLLAAAGDVPEEQVLDQLDLAVATSVLVPVDTPGRFRFAHALLRQVLLDDLTDLHRRRLHLRIATAIGQRVTSIPTRQLAGARPLPSTTSHHTTELAFHLLEALPLGDADMAARVALEAAEHADRRLAFHEAARWRRGALTARAADPHLARDLRRTHEIRVALALSLADAAERQAALDTLAIVIDEAEQLGDVEAMADAAIAFQRAGGSWYWMAHGTRPAHLIARLDRTLQALGTGDTARRSRVLGVRAIGEYYGDQEAGRQMAEQALAIARRLGEPQLIADTVNCALGVYWTAEGLERQRDLAAELLELSANEGVQGTDIAAWIFTMVARLADGDIDAAEQAHRRAWDLALERKLVMVQAQLGWAPAMFPLLRGDLASAARLIANARALHERSGLYALDLAHACALVPLALELDDLDAVPALFHAEISDARPEIEILRRQRAGQTREARDMLVRLRRTATPPSYLSLATSVLHARLAADLGEAGLASALIDELTPYAYRFADFGTVGCIGPVALQLGRLHALRGDTGAAVDILRDCVARMDRGGVLLHACRARQALASALRHRAGPGDDMDARQVAGEAAELARTLGLRSGAHRGS